MKNIVFIHGMFQNPKSWDKWQAFFAERGYNCLAPAWPDHVGDPAQLRANPPETLGELGLDTIVREIENVVTGVDEPILIGHSVGGLIVQLLINKGYGAAGVCIDSVAPNGMLAFDWGFFKNSMVITNPFKGSEPFEMDVDTFHQSFCNTMSMEETQQAYDAYATYDSRNVLRDCMGSNSHVDLELAHAPLLFIAGEQDEIIPPELNEKNAKAYTDETSVTDYKLFTNRSHYICGQPGWEEVATYIYEWLQQQVASGKSVKSAVL